MAEFFYALLEQLGGELAVYLTRHILSDNAVIFWVDSYLYKLGEEVHVHQVPQQVFSGLLTSAEKDTATRDGTHGDDHSK
tara:strand:- start:57 stop:296 length:240 start_codon:yes stop_codon:yes gene_type:complete